MLRSTEEIPLCLTHVGIVRCMCVSDGETHAHVHVHELGGREKSDNFPQISPLDSGERKFENLEFLHIVFETFQVSPNGSVKILPRLAFPRRLHPLERKCLVTTVSSAPTV